MCLCIPIQIIPKDFHIHSKYDGNYLSQHLQSDQISQGEYLY